MRVTPQCDSVNTFVIKQTDSVQTNPALDFDGTNYVVLWNDNTSGQDRILAARVTPAGNVLDSGNFIGESGHEEQFPDIVFNGTNYFAVWANYAAPYGAVGRFVNTSALPQGNVISIATTNTYKYMNPKVAYSGSNYLVVWPDMVPSTFNFNIYGQLISSTGSLIGSKITIADDSSPEREPYVVYKNSKYFVAWNDSGAIWGRYFNTSGQPMGPSFPVSIGSGTRQEAPWVAVSDTNYLAVWSEARTDRDIYGNVDLILGVNEESNRVVDVSQSFSTILSGPLVLPADKKCKVFDITGKTVNPAQIKPGIYFIEIEGTITEKVVKIK